MTIVLVIALVCVASLVIVAAGFAVMATGRFTGGGGPTIELSTMEARPFDLVRASTPRAESEGTYAAIFRTADGTEWRMPAVGVGEHVVDFAVPALFDARSGTWGDRVVDVEVVSVVAGQEDVLGGVRGFHVANLPENPLDRGAVTVGFVLGLRNYAEDLAASPGMDPVAASGLRATSSHLDSLAQDLQDLAGGRVALIHVGQAGGQDLDLRAVDLEGSDRMLAALLEAARRTPSDGSPQLNAMAFVATGSRASGPCRGLSAQQLQPSANDILAANERGEPLPSQAWLRAVAECSPDAAVTAAEVVAGSGGFALTALGALGATAAQLVLPAAALQSSLVNVGAWLVGVGVELRGVLDEVARESMEKGLELVEDHMKGLVSMLHDASEPEPEEDDDPWLTLRSMYDDLCAVSGAMGTRCPDLEPTTHDETEAVYVGTTTVDFGSVSSPAGECSWRLQGTITLQVNVQSIDGTVSSSTASSHTDYQLTPIGSGGASCPSNSWSQDSSGSGSGGGNHVSVSTAGGDQVTLSGVLTVAGMDVSGTVSTSMSVWDSGGTQQRSLSASFVAALGGGS